MMKKLFLLTTLCLTSVILTAQEWTINYAGDHPSGRIHFHDGIVDEDGVTFLAGFEGPDSDNPDALFMRIEPNGSHTEFKYVANGYRSKMTCIIETPSHNLFAVGNLYGDTDDYLLVLILDKHLNLLVEKQYAKEAEGESLGVCKATIDSHGDVIVSTSLPQSNAYQGLYYRGVFYKFDALGNLIKLRYLIEDYPDPLYFFMDFQLRQMWYNGDDETLLCLVPGYGNVFSFITFDSTFNYINEYPIWQDSIEKSDHTIWRDCYTDYWYNQDEALVFGSRGDADHNKLRVSRINTHGEILEFIRLNERTDTIDDAAQHRCMAAANDSTFYFSFHYHTWGYYPGNACVYMLNNQLEIIGRHVDDDHESYRTYLILPTSDGGCITVNDSCNHGPLPRTSRPIIKKLSVEDFDITPLSIVNVEQGYPEAKAYPNPCDETLHIIVPRCDRQRIRFRVYDPIGRIVVDRVVSQNDHIDLDVSRLNAGLYHYRIYADDETLFTEKFIKK
ncbi:MAG: T9SS type A sorting domain-containing protein [Bacteroidales bacterium]|nr:T9SS type A sorting domain-containing protein [Bacteroidales bacterium]